MSRSKQRHYLLYSNRVIIYIFSLLGLLYDTNLACVVALTLWVWMPQCLRIELNIIKAYQRFQAKNFQ